MRSPQAIFFCHTCSHTRGSQTPLLYTKLFTVHELCLTFHSQIFIFRAKFRAVFWKISKSRLWPIKRLLGHLKSLWGGLESGIYFGWWEVTIISCHSTPLYSYKYKKPPNPAHSADAFLLQYNQWHSVDLCRKWVTSTISEVNICALRPEKQFPSYEYECNTRKRPNLMVLLNTASTLTTE